ncbi:MAG: flagellar hook-basal body complex protein FliE [Euryarchaeota archaeon]|nr:flagellar hook-basal body complex protein FliE [Euryarchaeota archaeon]
MLVILLVGMPGAGKEEFVNAVNGMGFTVVRMGDVVREFVAAQGLPLKNEIVGKIAGSERDKHGVEIWAKRTVEKIKNMNPNKVIVDGVRCPEEVRVYRDELGNGVVVVGIFATQKDRFERIIRRNREDDVHTWEEFIEREERELSWGLGNVFARSDYMLLNTATLDEYHNKVRKLVQELEKEKV